MGVILVLAVVVLGFLCGRLQVTVVQLGKRVEKMELRARSAEHASVSGYDDLD